MLSLSCCAAGVPLRRKPCFIVVLFELFLGVFFFTPSACLPFSQHPSTIQFSALKVKSLTNPRHPVSLPTQVITRHSRCNFREVIKALMVPYIFFHHPDKVQIPVNIQVSIEKGDIVLS
jgi:hypothetical protein